MSSTKVCTCLWSPVNTTTVDPPHIIEADPYCPVHGAGAEPERDPDEDEPDA